MFEGRCGQNGDTHAESTSEINVGISAAVWETLGAIQGIAKYPEDQIVESRGMGTLIPHEVLTSQFAQAHPFRINWFPKWFPKQRRSREQDI
jgi:hypothetical protein